MFEPLVSIIIPVYNGSNYMREAIDSALAQTYKNIEVIVVNDGSNDEGATEEVARSYGERIRYFSKENGGVSSALNLGVQKMRGTYFSWLSHDDVYELDKVEKQIEAVRRNHLDENTLICCGSKQIDADSNPLPARRTKSAFQSCIVYPANVVLTVLLKKSTFNGCCLLIPKKVFSTCGLFNEHLRFCQDAFMWYQIFMKEHAVFCNENVSVKSRIHGGQLTQRGQSLFKKECEEMSYILADKLAEISTETDNFYRMYLLSDARYFSFKRVKVMIAMGKKRNLITAVTAIKALCICAYGHVRPIIRQVYYAVFRGIKAA